MLLPVRTPVQKHVSALLTTVNGMTMMMWLLQTAKAMGDAVVRSLKKRHVALLR